MALPSPSDAKDVLGSSRRGSGRSMLHGRMAEGAPAGGSLQPWVNRSWLVGVESTLVLGRWVRNGKNGSEWLRELVMLDIGTRKILEVWWYQHL